MKTLRIGVALIAMFVVYQYDVYAQYSKLDTINIWKGSWFDVFQGDEDEVMYMTIKHQDGFLYQQETREHKHLVIIMSVRYSCDTDNVMVYNNQNPLRATWIPLIDRSNYKDSNDKIAEDMLIIHHIDFYDESGNILNDRNNHDSMIDEECRKELYELVLHMFDGARIYSNTKRTYDTKEGIEGFGIAVTPLGIRCFQ